MRNIHRHVRRTAFLAASVAALATAGAGIATLSGCKGATATPVDCSAATAHITWHSVATVPPPAIWGAYIDAVQGTAYDSGVAQLELDKQTYPEHCIEHPVFTASGALPAGLTMDTSTGEISGTPTESGLFVIDLTVAMPGPLPGAITPLRFAIEVMPATTLYQAWRLNEEIRDEPSGPITALNGQLAFARAGTVSVELFTTPDGGFTWNAAPGTNAPPTRDGFTVGTDVLGHVYVSGGQTADGPLDDLWMHDGTAWQKVLDHTPFAGAARLFSDGTFLYAEQSGGVWRSADGGATWSTTPARAWDASLARADKCGVTLAGGLAIVAQDAGAPAGTPPTVRAFTSADQGLTWTEHVLPTSGPFTGLGGVWSCASDGTHLLVLGQGVATDNRSDALLTTDLDHWDYQPRSISWGQVLDTTTAAAVTVGGSFVFVSNGQTSASSTQ